jgi:glycosyltransferase involved in cell wall biosynthesis
VNFGATRLILGEAMSDPRPRLLIVSTVAVWPADNGFSLRAAALLPELASDWRITLLAPPGDHDVVVPREWGLEASEPLQMNARWTYLPTQYDTSSVLRAAHDVVRRFKPDVALLFGGAEYIAFDDPQFPPAVSDHIDCMTLIGWRALPGIHPVTARLRRLRELGQVALFERRLTRAMNVTLLVGEDDARAMRWLAGGGGDVRVLTNGVTPRADAAWQHEEGEPVVVFTGVLDYLPNVDAAIHLAHDIWPAVRRAVPGARLHLVGRRPVPPVLALERDSSIRVLADVPDLAVELQRGWVAAAPMRIGAGVKNKVLEAWAAGRPVVMTPRAANGLEPTPDLASLIDASVEGMADRIIALLRDRKRRVALGEAALSLARSRYGWDGVARQLSGILASACTPTGMVPGLRLEIEADLKAKARGE